MSLIPKDPVQNPCEADTFEEAADKNLARLKHERDLSESPYQEMKRNNDPHAESVNPEFWDGAILGNEQAYVIYKVELESFRKRVSERVSGLLADPPPIPGNAWKSGWKDTVLTWVKALQKNDPSIIVYW